VIIVRDLNPESDGGTVFKPDLQTDPDYVRKKFRGSVESFRPGQLADEPFPAPAQPRPAPPPAAGEPVPPKPPVGPPVEGAPPARPSLGIGEGGGPMPRLPLGGGLPWDSPATGPHVIHPREPGEHHRMPLLGELPDDYDG
jgi:hypothetical protein